MCFFQWSTRPSGRKLSCSGNQWQLQTSFLVTCMLALTFFMTCHYNWHDGRLIRTINSIDPQFVTEGSKSNGGSIRPNTVTGLECFQVHQPVWAPSGWKSTVANNETSTMHSIATPRSPICSAVLMEHSFGFSYGHPFIGYYSPPPCNFNRVIMNLTVTSRGRQFDRLALMYFNDTEVFRTSTAEPTVDGIIWTYTKDMSAYLSLWKEQQKVIFDLGNLVDETYTGLFNTTLTATFFTAPVTDNLKPADLILPLSARRYSSNASSHFILPESQANTTLSTPRNINRAVVSLSATGQAAEEFWWGNVPSAYASTFSDSIDSFFVGVTYPFPIIFTGGVVPGLWRPIVGIDTFDLRESVIDVSPFLPLLCDGRNHTFEIKISGLDEAGQTDTVGASWFVSGKLFLWLDDDPDAISIGSQPEIITSLPLIVQQQQVTQNRTGSNESLAYTTTVHREISISSVVRTQHGTHVRGWKQSITYTNNAKFTDFGSTQFVDLITHGADIAIGPFPYSTEYRYPLVSSTTMLFDPNDPQTNLTLLANLTIGCQRSEQGIPILPNGLEGYGNKNTLKGSWLDTEQIGSAYYFSSPSTRTGLSFGRTKQRFDFGALTDKAWNRGSINGDGHGGRRGLYRRDVEAVNGTVIDDHEWLQGSSLDRVTAAPNVGPAQAVSEERFVALSPKAVFGRGPGAPKYLSVWDGYGDLI